MDARIEEAGKSTSELDAYITAFETSGQHRKLDPLEELQLKSLKEQKAGTYKKTGDDDKTEDEKKDALKTKLGVSDVDKDNIYTS
jgi:hypothetical protein